MPLTKNPVTGMKDILPQEMELREYLLRIIKDTYESYGFVQIETPAMERLENLLSKQGGDNEKLIFKVLKRGEKLKLGEGIREEDLTDAGLRYDLTLPLARYYANNNAQLPSPFKALQIGNVYRADRPQKGRFRQFTQCDIDILGEGDASAQIELILATSKALEALVPGTSFTVHINDRRILKAMADYAGFSPQDTEKVFIILDKLDKIHLDGVKKELEELVSDASVVEKYLQLFEEIKSEEGCTALAGKLEGFLDPAVIEELLHIMESLKSQAGCTLKFDPSLVRGMGYYTGSIFEVSMEGFGGSVAGGGRYDGMIEKFTGRSVPACGFSIGFERIIAILQDQGFRPPASRKKIAMLYEKGISEEKFREILNAAQEKRREGSIVLMTKMNKNKKFQRDNLEKEGYGEFLEYYKEALRS